MNPETNQPQLQPFLKSNLGNNDKEIGSQNAPYFYKITSGHCVSKSGIIFHAQIGNESFMYGYTGVHSQSINLRCKFKGCPALAYARVPKSTGVIKCKGTRRTYRRNGKGEVKARLEKGIFSPRNRKILKFLT